MCYEEKVNVFLFSCKLKFFNLTFYKFAKNLIFFQLFLKVNVFQNFFVADQNGNVGILFHANTSEDLLSFYATVSTRDYVLLVDAYMFNR